MRWITDQSRLAMPTRVDSTVGAQFMRAFTIVNKPQSACSNLLNCFRRRRQLDAGTTEKLTTLFSARAGPPADKVSSSALAGAVKPKPFCGRNECTD